MTLIAPLTTTFTPPPHCTSSAGLHISEWKPSPAQGLWYAVGPLQSPPHFPCFPPSYNPTTQNYYSPGLCPSGYTPACTSRNTIASLTETIYTCCPTAQGFTFSCISDAPFSWMSTLACDVWLYGEGGTGMMTFEGVTFVDLEGRTKVTRTERSEVGIGAHGVEVRFQAGDFGREEQVVGTGSGTGTEGAGTTGVGTEGVKGTGMTGGGGSRTGLESGGLKETGISGPGTGTEVAGGGLSTAAAAGIGAAAAVLVLGLVALGVWVWRRKRAAKVESGAAGDDAPMPVESAVIGWPPYEKDDQKVYVVPARPAYEVDSSTNRYELPSMGGRAEAP